MNYSEKDHCADSFVQFYLVGDSSLVVVAVPIEFLEIRRGNDKAAELCQSKGTMFRSKVKFPDDPPLNPKFLFICRALD